MSQIDRFREQIDACRSGSDDLALPALAELAQAAADDRTVADELARSEHFDRRVAAAMHDVVIPAGLMERLLAAVQHRPGEHSEASQETTGRIAGNALAAATEYRPEEATVSLSKTAAHSDGAESRHSRRFWLRAGVLAASLALVGLATIRFWPRPQHRVAAHDLAAAVGSWTKTVGMPPVGWTTTQPLPAGFSLPQGIPVRPNSWRSFKTREGWPSIAIDYSSSGRPATLFIVRSSAQFAVPTIPFTRLPSSGPAMAAWQKGNLLYVLVVFENGQRLEDFIHPPTLS